MARLGVWLGSCVPDLLPDRLDQPLRAASGGLAAAGTPAGVGLPADPGRARHDRPGERPPAAGQALLGVPAVVRQPARPRSLLHALERASLGLLVASSLFEVSTGVLNIAQWYPFRFYFPTAHHAMAWVAMGSLAVHIAVKLPITQRALTRPLADGERTARAVRRRPDRSARGGGSSTASAAPQPASSCSASGRPSGRCATSPSCPPADRASARRGCRSTARRTPRGWARPQSTRTGRLELVGPRGTQRLSRDQLTAMPRHEADLPIACVEGWSSGTTWGGVRMRDLVRAAGGDHTSSVKVESLEQIGVYKRTELPRVVRLAPEHVAGAGHQGREAAHRARLSGPDHRAQPAGSAADQVGRPAHRLRSGADMNRTTADPRRRCSCSAACCSCAAPGLPPPTSRRAIGSMC